MARRMMILALLALLLFLAGCGPATGNRDTSEGGVTIVYRREGGFAGLSQEWVIHLDGLIEAPGELQMRVPPAEVQALLDQSAEMVETPATPEPTPCCDRFTYSVTIIAGDQETTFTLSEGVLTDVEEAEMFAAVESLINTAEPLP